MQKYDIKSQKVWYNPKTFKSYKCKTKGCIRFDSIGEFNLYKRLNKFFIYNQINVSIDIHTKVYIGKNKFWSIDFCIRFDDTELDYFKNVIKLINKSNKNVYIKKSIYIEYKGVLNKQYIDKQTILTKNQPELDNKIIILSDNPKAILMEFENMDYNIKYVHSTDYFFEVLRLCLQQH